MEQVTCHVCRSADVAPYATVHGYELQKCTACALLFVSPLPTEEEIAAVYSTGYFQHEEGDDVFGYADYDQDKESMRPTFEKYLDVIESRTSGKTLFDVGAATGFFLDIAAARGLKTGGNDIAEYAVEAGKKKGHEMWLGDLTELEIPQKYAVVTMWDVLEHVRNPRQTMQSVFDLVEEDGVVVINTVDAKSWWARALGKRWNAIVPPEHLHYFAPNNVTALLEEVGFTDVWVTKIAKKFSLPYIFKTLHRWQGLKIWNWLAAKTDRGWLRTLAIPVNLRDNMVVFATKPKQHDSTH